MPIVWMLWKCIWFQSIANNIAPVLIQYALNGSPSSLRHNKHRFRLWCDALITQLCQSQMECVLSQMHLLSAVHVYLCAHRLDEKQINIKVPSNKCEIAPIINEYRENPVANRLVKCNTHTHKHTHEFTYRNNNNAEHACARRARDQTHVPVCAARFVWMELEHKFALIWTLCWALTDQWEKVFPLSQDSCGKSIAWAESCCQLYKS